MVRRPLMRQAGRWAIVLSGGEGTRLRDFTLSRFGEARPKQYCAFLGERTMLDHTLARAEAIVGRRRIVTVLGRGHQRYVEPSSLAGFVIEQPRNCDTAPGILLPLTTVLAYDPEATVIIFPSDHYIRPNKAFTACMDQAAALAEREPRKLILAAAVADEPETEYGWIQPGALAHRRGGLEAYEVLQFHEKPGAAQAREFHEQGFLWNTFIMAGKARAFWELTRAFHPELVARYERIKASVGRPDAAAELAAAYEGVPAINFSRSVLERASDAALVVPMTGIEWNDWGRPERIMATLDLLVETRPMASSPAFVGAAL